MLMYEQKLPEPKFDVRGLMDEDEAATEEAAG